LSQVSIEMGDRVWATTSCVGYNVLVCNPPLWPTQPPLVSRMRNEYLAKSWWCLAAWKYRQVWLIPLVD